ncbi:MAG TPA: hypothetical protein VFH29_06275 [Anaerolineales bacterium]|nr:hypothetical protein [Anaerolineales bacterium]
MNTFVDEKGKVYTDVVRTVAIRSRVQTITHLLVGDVHVRPGDRLKDELDANQPFLAVTDAEILAADGQMLFRAPFLAVSREQIVWVMPVAPEVDAGTP